MKTDASFDLIFSSSGNGDFCFWPEALSIPLRAEMQFENAGLLYLFNKRKTNTVDSSAVIRASAANPYISNQIECAFWEIAFIFATKPRTVRVNQ